MTRPAAITGAFLLSLLVASTAKADTVLINFDVAPDSTAVENGTRVDSLYSSLGVTFESTASDNGVFASQECLTQGTISDPNIVTLYAAGGCSDISEDVGLVRARFVVPTTDACVSFIPAHGSDYAVLRAYDESHNLLKEIFSAVGVTEEMCISWPAGISSIEFSGVPDHWGWFDNLTFVPGIVPVKAVTFGAIKALYR